MSKFAFLFALSGLIHLTGVSAAKKIVLSFQAEINGETLVADSLYVLGHSGDSIRIETFRWYVSGVQLLAGGRAVWSETDGFHLVDIFDSSRKAFSVSIPSTVDYEQVRFNLGIDSMTNVAGAIGGDLDAVHGMYWTWQSGYINAKVEGTSSASPARKHEFQFHLGGYATPNASLQTITLNAPNTNKVRVVCDLGQWLQGIPMNTQHHIMSPSMDAVALSTQLAKLFSIDYP